MTREEITESIRGFLTNDLLVEFDDDVNDDTDLFEAGLVDSFGFVELVAFIELTYPVLFTDEELLESPMNTLSAISDLVVRKI